VADALGYAHGLGVVHRDIKPENILLAAGHARVADFGIARAVRAAGGERLTGTGIALGTPVYMSPEQASGEQEVDSRSDIYALGCVVYEMLAGDPPFTGSTPQAVLARKSVQPPPALRPVRDTVPAAVELAVLKALARLPADRFATVAQFADALTRASTQTTAPERSNIVWARTLWSAALRNRWLVMGGVAVTIAVIAGAVRAWEHQSQVRWARTEALPEATRLIAQGETHAAFQLLRQAEALMPDDPTVEGLFVEATTPVSVRTTPPGAQVYIRDFYDGPDEWELVGSAPLDAVRLPRGRLVWKVSLEGFVTKEAVTLILPSTYDFALQPAAETPKNMVQVRGGVVPNPWILADLDIELDEFWIDKYEVTNRRFKAFIDRGGYERPEYWTEPIVDDGVAITFAEARGLFRDRTGRPGPAMWELGTHPDGQGDYPVGGISWYEASAYCASVGKGLPTIYHWYQAADAGLIPEFTETGHFLAEGPAEAGHPLRLGAHGTYDMAGNVKEWVWNEDAVGRRYIVGGGWAEPTYHFQAADASAPLDREPMYGVRCAQYPAPLPAAQMGPVAPPFRDWRNEAPVGDDVFAVYRGLYDYDRTIPLEPSVDPEREQYEHWSVEQVSFTAAYGNERVPSWLFLPKSAPPPYQTVVFFPGVEPWLQETFPGDLGGGPYWFLFLVRSGRAVLFPMYKGMWERHIGHPFRPQIWRDIAIYSAKDLRRAVDYLETRPDIDARRLAHLGFSSGASFGPIMTAVEPRFQASVLLSGGLLPFGTPPESEAVHFLPRVTVPTLLINGRHDFYYPHDTSQRPMFELLGPAPADKRHVVFEGGHTLTDRPAVMREVLDWLDRYLGPVSRP
jgi:predicted esterase